MKDRRGARTARHIRFDKPTRGGRAGEAAPPTVSAPPVAVTNLIARHPRWGSRVPLVPEQRVPGFRGLVAVRAGGRRPLPVRPHAGGDLGRAPVA